MIVTVELAVLMWERKYSSGILDRERGGCLGTLGHRRVRCLEIQLQDGRTCNRHMDHIRKRGARSDQSAELADDEDIPRPQKDVTKEVTTTSPDTFDTPVTVRESDAQMVDPPTQELTLELTHGVEEPGRHYPARTRRPPTA